MCSSQMEPSEEPFNISAVSKEVKPQPLTEKKIQGKKPSGFGVSSNGVTQSVDTYEKLLSSFPEFSGFGPLFKSSSPIELTEAETEYAVNVVKHIYSGHIVFQYNCTNTISEQLLENVTVIVDASEAEEFAKVDPASGEVEEEGVEDEYQLEDFEVVAADYMLRAPVLNFKNAWDSLGPDCERIDEYGLGVRESLAEAVNAVINILGMQPCEGTEVVPNNARSHTCLLSGIFIGNVKVLVRLSFGIDGPKQVAMKLAVRSEDVGTSDAIHEIVANG
ncbi:hypothetical protein HPP92_000765 [Vanilla planifolia]|uniref:Coatomer subunit gamma-2 n=1 Tax=Vanilla planifolia TaxID=51239 RepID=A0A835VKY4_VANPL|nr:hypothetical protein HPP92_000765 [Vanilla planifolia]